MKVVSVFLGAFVAAALGVPLNDVVHEKRHVSSSFVVKSAANSQTIVPVRIALKQRNLDKGMDYLLDVSDPVSINYGKHYTRQEVSELFAPSQTSIDAVKTWLVDAGIPESEIGSTKSKGWIEFNTTVEKLEKMLKTDYKLYKHRDTGSEHLGTDGYSLPSQVSEHVDFITPAVAMTQVKRSTAPRHPRVNHIRPLPAGAAVDFDADSLSNCDTKVTPECIKALYNITDGTGKDSSNRLGMYQLDSEMHRQEDLDQFYKSYATNIPAGWGPNINLINWGDQKPNTTEAGGEAALDHQVAIPVIYPQGIELYQTHTNYNSEQRGLFNQFLDAVDGEYCTYKGGDDPNVDGVTPNQACGTLTPANVISISYGLTEITWPTNYLKRQCEEFMKLSLQGVSIVFSSGDGGVAGGHGNECLGKNEDIFNVPAPVSCPYVIAVGATTLPKGSKVGDDEIAVDTFGSGGGFSNIYPIPTYQKNAVSKYFTDHNPGFKSYSTTDGTIPTDGGIYNRNGRGFPDVAAAGEYGAIIHNGETRLSGGTSMSAPIFAAILTRINEERIRAGKKSIGFANPAFYKNPSMFHDVTKGDQSARGGACKGKSFSAVKGWDPVTGLGTPNYPAMLKYFMSLP